MRNWRGMVQAVCHLCLVRKRDAIWGSWCRNLEQKHNVVQAGGGGGNRALKGGCGGLGRVLH